MKSNRHGRGETLSPEQLRLLFSEGLLTPRDRMLFAICLYCGCRISEALALKTTDIKGGKITFRKSTTKGKLQTREVDITLGLDEFFSGYKPPKPGALFPGKHGVREHLSPFTADKILRVACKRVGLLGVSTHSFRRTALTMMHNANVPLAHIQEISGHHDLGTLRRYLEVSDEQKKAAVMKIGF